MKGFANDEMYDEIKRFACHIYGKKPTNCLNELCYQIYCQQDGVIPCELLLPCEYVLRLHTNRANYQAKVWRSNLDPFFDPPCPVDHR